MVSADEEAHEQLRRFVEKRMPVFEEEERMRRAHYAADDRAMLVLRAASLFGLFLDELPCVDHHVSHPVKDATVAALAKYLGGLSLQLPAPAHFTLPVACAVPLPSSMRPEEWSTVLAWFHDPFTVISRRWPPGTKISRVCAAAQMWAVVAGGATARAREAPLANACARWPMQWLFTGVLPGEARGYGGVSLATLAIHIATVWQVTGYCTDGDGVKRNDAQPRMAFVADVERRVMTLYMAIASLENTKLLQPGWATEARTRLDHLRVLFAEIGMLCGLRQVEDGKIDCGLVEGCGRPINTSVR